VVVLVAGSTGGASYNSGQQPAGGGLFQASARGDCRPLADGACTGSCNTDVTPSGGLLMSGNAVLCAGLGWVTISFLWGVTSCELVGTYQSFGGIFCAHLHVRNVGIVPS
jgi:hypothetical protein